MASGKQRGVSAQQLMDISRPIAEWVFACDNQFFLNVDFSLKRFLNDKEKVTEISIDVTFFYPDAEAEGGYHNACICMFTFDKESRLNQKKEFIQKALQAKNVEELIDCVRQANEYPE